MDTKPEIGDVVSIDGRHARVTSEPYWCFHATGFMGWAVDVEALDDAERGSFSVIRLELVSAASAAKAVR